MQLKIKIDLVNDSTSSNVEEVAPYDLIKIRNFLLLLAILSSLIFFGVYHAWIDETKQPVLTPSITTSEIHITDSITPKKPQLIATSEVDSNLNKADLAIKAANAAIELDSKVVDKEVAEPAEIIKNVTNFIEENDRNLQQVQLKNSDITSAEIFKTDIKKTEINNQLLLNSPLSAATQPNIKFVERAQLTLAIVNREPINNIKTLSLASQKFLYFFTQINHKKHQNIYHRWVFNEKVMAQVTLSIGSNQWRTSSSKNFDRTMIGQWFVYTLDQDENILNAIEFEVTL